MAEVYGEKQHAKSGMSWVLLALLAVIAVAIIVAIAR